MYETKMKLIGLIVIVVLLVASIPATLFALSEGEAKTKIMKVGESFEIGADRMWSSQNPEIVNIEYRPCPKFEGATHDYAFAVASGTAILTSKSHEIMKITVVPKETPEFKIYGYIKPDFQFQADKANSLKSSFRVELINTSRMATVYTYADGYFEISQVLANTEGYAIRICKDGYLTRYINISATNGDCELSTIDAPIKMWAGDIKINGVQDDAINMKDIMELASRFNSSKLNSDRYKYEYDLNKDGSINMVDIMIIAQNFNKSPKDYPEVQANYIPASTVPTPTPTSTPTIPVPTSTSTLFPTPTTPIPPIPTPTQIPTLTGVQTFKPAPSPGTYEVDLKVGDVCEIELQDSCAPGISWIHKIENRNIVVYYCESQVKIRETTSGIDYKHTWYFKAIAEGTTSIVFRSKQGDLKFYKVIVGKGTSTVTPVPSPTPTPES